MPDDNSNANNGQKVEDLKKYIASAEESLEAAKKALLELTGEDIAPRSSSTVPLGLKVSGDGKIIEGIFNGENMVGPEGKVFPVPANYASKSKLVEGDRLKLTIAEDGSFIFKQIGPVARQKLVGELQFADNTYFVRVDGKKYKILYAAVTYHKAKPGDNITIVVPGDGESEWSALENILHDVSAKDATTEEESILDLNPQDNQDDAFKLDEGIFGNQPTQTTAADDSQPSAAPDVTQTASPAEPDTQSPPEPEPVASTSEPSEPGINSTVRTQPVAPPIEPVEQIKPVEPIAVAPTSTDPLDPAKQPEESFLPRTQSDETNSMGEGLPGAAEPADVPELEI